MKNFTKRTLWLLLSALLIFVLVSVFLLADLRTADIKNNTQSQEQIQLAKNLLNAAIKKQGLDKINQFSTYEIVGIDIWKGVMGKMGNPWDWDDEEISLRFSVGDFDSRVEVLEGEQMGFVAGIQSWDYYESVEGKYQSNINDDKGKIFTMAAFHYFIELGNRLSNAPLIRYAGQDEFKGKAMDKIFVSWGNEATKAYDQYLLWIGKASGLIEATAFTTRDNPLPAPAFMYGSMRFDDYRNIDGILIPFKHTAQLGDPKDDIDNFIHQLTIREFKWDNFPISELRPFKNMNTIGDDKPKN